MPGNSDLGMKNMKNSNWPTFEPQNHDTNEGLGDFSPPQNWIPGTRRLFFMKTFARSTKRYTLPETNELHLKMDSWNTSLLLGWPIFRPMLVSGSVNLILNDGTKPVNWFMWFQLSAASGHCSWSWLIACLNQHLFGSNSWNWSINQCRHVYIFMDLFCHLGHGWKDGKGRLCGLLSNDNVRSWHQ